MLAGELAGPGEVAWAGVWRGFAGGVWNERDFKVLRTTSREFAIWQIPLADLPRFEVTTEGWGLSFGPSLVWPFSREWLAHCDIDFYSTVVACDNRVAELLLASDAEIPELEPNTWVGVL